MQIELKAISRRYADVRANDAISLILRPGEVHCLLGENGAGKSTLISILAGMQQPDSGRIEVDGRPVVMGSPGQARKLGLGVVYQESALIPEFTVRENLLLGQSGFRLAAAALEQQWQQTSAQFFTDIALDMPVAVLSLGQRQLLEIYKTVLAGAQLLVLDEPTSLLAPAAVEQLMQLVSRLAAGGMGVLFVTHKLREAFRVADRVSVLRGGQLQASFAHAPGGGSEAFAAFEARVISLMFADAPEPEAVDAEAAGLQAGPAPGISAQGPVLELRDLHTMGTGGPGQLQQLSLQLRAGEIFGIAGMEGNGQQALAEVVAGQRAPQSGHLLLDGADITQRGVAGRQRLGLRYISDDRRGEASVGGFNAALNLLLKRIGQPPFWRRGIFRRAAAAGLARRVVQRYRIALASVFAPVADLSGGNLQKLVFARELEGQPRVLVANKPTYGLDLAAVHTAHELLRSFAAAGGCVLLISNELGELQALSDRVGVMSGGRITAVLDTAAPGFMQELHACLVR